jgi:hypothetical protein
MERLTEILAAIGFMALAFTSLFFFYCVMIYFHNKNKKPAKALKVNKPKKYVTFTKRKFDIILYHGIFWVDLSYVLAFMGKPQIAEALSVQAIISIIGVFAAYCIKSAFEKKIGKEKEEYEETHEEAYQ